MEEPWRARWHAIGILLLLGVLSTGTPAVNAVSYTLTGKITSSSQPNLQWSNAQIWTPTGVPAATDTVTIPNTNSVSGCRLQVTSDTTIANLTMTDTNSRTCAVQVLAGVTLTVTDTLTHGAYRLVVEGSVQTQTLMFSGYYLQGSSSQSNSQLPTRGVITATGSMVIRRGSFSTKYLQWISLVNNGSALMNTDMSSRNLYCYGCILLNYGTFVASEARFYITGTIPLPDADGFRIGVINRGTFVFNMATQVYFYWGIKNYGTVNVLTIRWGSRYRLYCTNSNGVWVNKGTINLYMAQLYLRYVEFRGDGGTVNVYGRPGVYESSPSTPAGSYNRTAWSQYINILYGNIAAQQYYWRTDFVSYFTIYTSFGRLFQGGRINTFGRAQVYLYWTYSTSTTTQPQVASFNQGLNLSPSTDLQINCGSSSNRLSRQIIHIGGSSPAFGQMLVGGGCQVRVASTSPMQVIGRLSVYQGAILEMNSALSKVFNNKVYVSTSAQFALVGGTATFYDRLTVASSLNASSCMLMTQSTFIWSSGTIFGDATSQLTTSGPAYILGTSTPKKLQGIKLAINRQTQPSSGRVIAEYFQYRISTNRTRQLSSIQYWPGQSTSTYSLPASFDNSTTIPTLTQLETSLQRPPSNYGSAPLDWRPTAYTSSSSSDISFSYNYATRIWFFLQIDTAGSYSFYINNGYSIGARLWINDKVQSPIFPFYRINSVSDKDNTPITVSLSAGTVRMRMDYFVRTSSYWNSWGQMLLISYSGPNIAKQFIPLSKVSWKRTVAGKTEFANPDAAMNVSSTISQMDVRQDSLMFMTHGASISIGSSGLFNVLTDLSILAEVTTTGKRNQLTNAGELRKYGSPGVASFFLDYVNQGGKISNIEGKIEFPASGGGLVSWNNTAGGLWNDKDNWIPNRVPTAGDIVLITAPGTYSVVVTKTAVAESVFVGDGGQSTPAFTISHFALLTISDRLDIHTPTITLNGALDAVNVIWSGQNINGAGTGCVLTARSSFAVLAGSSSTSRYFRDVVIENMGKFGLDASLESGYLYCSGCKVINSGNMIFNSIRFYWQTGGCSSSVVTTGDMTDPCVQSGVVNTGTITVEMYTRSTYWYYVRIFSTSTSVLRAVSNYWRRASTFYIQYPYLAGGRLQSYMSYIQIQYRSNPFLINLDAVEVYGAKYFPSGTPTGANVREGSPTFLSTLYSNPSPYPYDVNFGGSRLSIYNIYGSSTQLYNINIGTLSAFGRADFSVNRVYYTRITITKSVGLSESSSLLLPDLSGQWGVLNLPPTSMLGFLTVGRNWLVTAPANTMMSAYSNVYIRQNGTLTISGGSCALRNAVVGIGGFLNIMASSALLGDYFQTYGNVNFGSTAVSCSASWWFGQGQVAGSKITTSGKWTINGASSKTVTGLSVTIQLPPQVNGVGTQGVFAEYFQMRIGGSQNPTPTGTPRNFPPFTAFEDPATEPIYWRFEPDIGHEARYKNWAPVQYSNNGANINTSSVYSFTYNFAVRYWTWLKVPTDGMYNFTLRSDYGLRPRLWIDGKVLVTGNFNQFINRPTATYMGSQTLTRGFHRLRLDVLQISSYYTTFNGMLVYMSGPGIPMDVIPSSMLSTTDGTTPPNYAQPAYNATRGQNSFATSMSGGEIFAWGSADITVSMGALLDVQSDVALLCYSDTPCTLTNYGTLRRSGGYGPAQLSVAYDNKSVGILDEQVSSLTFSQANGGNRISWVAQTHGYWNNASNWLPQRLPEEGDVVTISLPGSYVVFIPDGVTVNVSSVIISGGASLEVSHFANLYVTGRLELGGPKVTVSGTIAAADVVWSGGNIVGSVAAIGPRQLVARKTMLISGSGNKYLTDVTVVNYGMLSQDMSLQYQNLYCSKCIVRTMAGANTVMTVRGLYLSGSQQVNADGFRAGFENYGSLVFRPSGQYVYLNWDIRNYGRVVVLPWYYLTQVRPYFRSVFINFGVVDIYMSAAYGQYNSGFRLPKVTSVTGGKSMSTENGQWTLYSRPLIFSTGSIRGNRSPMLWREWLEDVYSTGYYDGSRYCYFYLQYTYGNMYFGKLATRGNVQIDVRYSRTNNITVGHLDMDQSGLLYLYRGSSTSYRPFFVLERAAKPHRVAFVYSYYGQLVVNGDVTFTSGISITTRGGVFVQPQNMAIFQQYVLLYSSAILSITNGQAQFMGTLRLNGGTFTIPGCTVTILGQLQWSTASVSGVGGRLVVARDSQLTSNSRQLQDVTLEIDALQVEAMQRGFIAEYFQYRTTLPGRSYFYSDTSGSTSQKLPSSFDNLATKPTYYRFENFVQRLPSYYGVSPKTINNGASGFTTSSSSTAFSYYYAARLSSYLNVPTTGDYTFYLRTGYALRARIWIDGKLQFTSPTGFRTPSSDETSPALSLTAGYHLLRIDFLVGTTSYLSTYGAMLAVSWSGPAIAKSRLPVSSLYPFLLNATSGTYKCAAESAQYVAPVSTICSSNLTALQAIAMPFSYGRLRATGGLTSSRNGRIVVGSRGVLDLATGTSWQISASNRIELYLSGLATKTAGTGLLNLNTLFNISATGCENAQSGTLELGVDAFGATAPTVSGTGTVPVPTVNTATSSPPVYPPGVTTTWNNTRGGDWADASNWDVRVPNGNDIAVLPQLTSRYTVTVSADAVMKQLTADTLGSTSTYVALRVNNGVSFTVSGTAQLNNYYNYFYGVVTVGRLEWSGYRIYGNTNGKLNVINSGTIIRGGLSSKYLYQIELINNGNFVVDQSMNSNNFYCGNCLITNQIGANFTTNAMSLRVTNSRYPGNTLNTQFADGNPRHFTNLGTFTMVLNVARRYSYIYFAFSNSGTMTFIGNGYPSSYYVYFYAMPVKTGRIVSYFTTFYWFSQNTYGGQFDVAFATADVEMYGYPLLKPNAPRIQAGSSIAEYDLFIQNAFVNATDLWDTSYQIQLRIYNVYNKQASGGKFVTHGYVGLGFSNVYGTTFSNVNVQQDSNGLFTLGSTSNTANTMSFNDSTLTSTIDMYSGWYVTLQAGSVTNFLWIRGSQKCGATVTNGVSTLQRLYSSVSCSLTLMSATVSSGIVDLYGPVNLMEGSTLTAMDLFRWTSGKISGTGSGNRLMLPGYSNITGFDLKVHDAVDITYSREAILQSRNGVLAQYFHYRNTGGNTTAPSQLNYFPSPDGTLATGYLPSSFDDLKTTANFQRIESSVQRPPAYYRNRVDLFTGTGGIDYSSDLSFTRLFALRMLSYIKINSAGEYTFYLRNRYGPVRIWIDGKIIATGPQYANIYTELVSNATTLTAGYHVLRVDVVVGSSSDTNAAGSVLLAYSSASVPKQLIPSSTLFIFNPQTSAPVSAAIVSNVLTQRATVASEAVMARSGASVTVAANRQVYIDGDMLWLSFYSPSVQSTMNLQGSLIKTGGGIATFYMTYAATGAGSLVEADGKIQFQTPTVANVPVFWNNSAGGVWDVASNWYPQRVPTAGSIVFIDLPGAYTIIVPSKLQVVVEDLIVGGLSSNPLLYISSQSTLKVNDRFDLVVPRFTVQGTVDVGRMTLNSQYIIGSSGVFASSSKLIIRKSLSFISKTSSSLYLQNIEITNYGTMTMGSSSRFVNVYCQSCSVVNMATLIILRTSLRVTGTFPSFDSNDFRMGIRNMGKLYWDMRQSSSYYCYWDVANMGTMSLVGDARYPYARVYMYGSFSNTGAVSIYSSSLYMYSNYNQNRQLTKGVGSFAMFGAPALNLTTSVSRSTALSLENYIATYYSGLDNTKPQLWESRSSSQLYFQNFYYKSATMSTLRAVGFATITFSNCRYSNFTITASLDLGSLTRLNFYRSARSNFLATGVRAVGTLYNSGYWSVTLTSAVSGVQVFDTMYLSGNASVELNSATSISFMRSIAVPEGTTLWLTSPQIVFHRKLIAAGTLQFGAGTRTFVRGNLVWGGGALTGVSPTSSYLTVSGGCNFTGSATRTLDALNFGVQLVANEQQMKVVAEYFQVEDDEDDGKYYYWASNNTRCTVNSQCLPQSFDMPMSAGTATRLESSFGITQVQTNPSPLPYTNAGTISGQSYYNYGVRRTAFLRVTTSGMYRFTIIGFYRVPRVWVNGDVLYTGSTYTSTGYPAHQTPFINLNIGYHILRIDEIVVRSSQGGLDVYYEGPGVAFQRIPATSLALMNPTTGAYPTPRWATRTRSTCVVSDDSLTLLRNSARLNITAFGTLDLQTDALFYSSHLATQPGMLVNNGGITKSGGTGEALFLGQYTGVGMLPSSVRILSSTSGTTGVVFWNNPSGGRWSVASNWMPQRLPTAGDYVFITLPGKYKVVADGKVQCRQLDIGAADADVDFVVDYSSSLAVDNKLFLNSQTTTLHGSITAGSISWSGQTINGVPLSGKQVSIQTSGGFSAIGSISSSRVLSGLKITMGGNSVWVPTVTYLTLTNTNITLQSGGVLSMGLRYFGRSRSTPGTFGSGLINYGTLLMASSSTLYMYSGLLNYGTVHFGRACVTSSSSVNLYGYFGNVATTSVMNFYRPYVYFQSQVTLPKLAQGTMNFYGAPYIQSSKIPGNCDIAQFMNNINIAYNASTYSGLYAGSGIVWNTGSTSYIYIYEQSLGSANFSTVNVQGRVEMRVYRRSNSNLTFSTALNMGPQSTLNMYSGRSINGRSGYIFFPRSFSAGQWYMQSGWNLVFAPEMTMTIWKDLVVRSPYTLSFNGGSLNFQSALILMSGSTISANNLNMAVSGNVFHYGTMQLTSCTADFGLDVTWTQGTIKGRDTWIYIRRRVTSQYSTSSTSSSTPLNLAGTNMRVVLQGKVASPSNANGVLAEYFQYRIGTERLSYINGFYNDSSSQYLTPQSFDDATATPTYSRIEPSVSYIGEWLSHYPLAYASRSTSSDSNNMLTFTYNFAVRYTFFANIPVTNMNYRIHFTGPYYTSKTVRVWVNDTIPSRTIVAGRYPRSAFVSGIKLVRGYNKIRVDVIQTSSYSTSVGNMLYVSYELPGIIPKTLLNNGNTFFRQSPYWRGEGSPFPAPSFKVLQTPVCQLEGENITQDLCNKVGAGVSCWNVAGQSYVNSNDGPSIWVTKSGVLDVTSTADWAWNNTRLSLLSSGIVARTSNPSSVQLNTQYAISGGCTRLEAGSLPANLNLGIADGATFPPTTEPPPTLPAPTTMPPVDMRAPSSWTPHDVQEWIATLGDGEFAELGSFYAGYSGEDLIALTREDFVALAGPGNEELAGKLYEALKTQEKEFEEQTDKPSNNTAAIAAGVSVGVVALIALVVVVIIVRRRGKDDTMVINGHQSKRLSQTPIMHVQNPGYANEAYDTGSMASRHSSAADRPLTKADEVMYEEAANNGEENLYEDLGAKPGYYANTPSRPAMGEDTYEVMG